MILQCVRLTVTKEQEALLLATAEGVRLLVKNALDKGCESKPMIEAMVDAHMGLIIATDYFIQRGN